MKKKAYLSILLCSLLQANGLNTINVIANEKTERKTQLNQYLDSKDIKNKVTNNADIASLLKENPNIRIIENSDPGSIEPSKIMINEAKYYQNAFLIDNLSADSLLDPNSENRIDDVKGNENEVFLDLDLIDTIKIYDSAVPSKFGSFSGGVIDVKLKNPSAKPSGKIGFRYTNESMAKINNPKETYGVTKPNYKKYIFNTSYSGPINDNSGIIFSFNKKEAQNFKPYLANQFKTKSKSTNALIKYSKYLDNGLWDLAFMYSPYLNEDINAEFEKDSEYESKGGALNVNTNYEVNINSWNINSNIALKSSENTRTTKTNDLKYWRQTEKQNWGIASNKEGTLAIEGSWGDIEKTQNSILSKINANKKFDNHKLDFGLELNYIKGTHKRKNELIVYKEANESTIGLKCNGYTEDCIENDQYFTRRDIYKKENVSANMFSNSLYAEDTITYLKNHQLRIGLRTDYNDYLKNFDLAPRVLNTFKFFEGKTRVLLGFNRYYGKSFLAYKLREARTPFKSEYRSSRLGELNSSKIPSDRINPTVWNKSADKGDIKYIFSDLQTPYTDENLLGFTQEINSNILKFKYVHRKSKKQFMSDFGAKKLFTRPDNDDKAFYHERVNTNNGRGWAKLYTVSISNLKDIKLANSFFSYNLSYRKSKSKTFFTNYDSLEDNSQMYIFYNDKVQRAYETSNYKKPDRYNLSLNLLVPNIDILSTKGELSTTLAFEYKESFIIPNATGNQVELKIDGEKLPLQIYKDKKIKDSKKLDFKMSYLIKKRKHNLQVKADILNILNDYQEEDRAYKVGRQYWLGLEYSF